MTPPPPPSFAGRCLDEFVLAMTLLTRIPMPPARVGDNDALSRAVWAYPLVGALVGAMGALVFLAARTIGLAAGAAAWLGLAATILATGCFHEDGLADFWDGIGGGRTIERKLEIMRDSRIGSYGAAALILALGIRASLVAALDEHGLAEAGLIAAGLAGRVSIAGILAGLDAARTDGLAVASERPAAARVAAAGGTGLLLVPLVGPFAALSVAFAVVAVVLIMRWLMRRQIGGYTGDGLGATEQKTEIAVLAALQAVA
jgi:adenosylcobinamide-GDP ribazoletransferase